MTNEQINAKVIELKEALIAHRNFLDSLPNEVVDVLNDSCYYVNGSIDQIDGEIFDIENFLERDESDDDSGGGTISDDEIEIAIRRGIIPMNGTSEEEIEKIRDAYVKEWREKNK